MKRIGKPAGLTLALAAVLLLTGCLDVFHSVGGDAGRLDTYFRFTLQAALMEMGSQGEGESLEDIMNELPDEGVYSEGIPEDGELEFGRIGTETEAGFWYRYRGSWPDGVNTGGQDTPFLPYRDGNDLVIPLSESEGMDEEMDAQSRQMMEAILGGARYRLLIGRRVLPKLKEATFISPEGEIPLEIIDTGENWLVDFPLLRWMEVRGFAEIRLR